MQGHISLIVKLPNHPTKMFIYLELVFHFQKQPCQVITHVRKLHALV